MELEVYAYSVTVNFYFILFLLGCPLKRRKRCFIYAAANVSFEKGSNGNMALHFTTLAFYLSLNINSAQIPIRLITANNNFDLVLTKVFVPSN